MLWLSGGGEAGDQEPARLALLRRARAARRRWGRRRERLVERLMGVAFDLVGDAREGEQRGALDGLLTPLDPQRVDEIELVAEREIF
ncbi:hypothetical protein ACIBG4_40765 [Nonomuraea sp. NPDC050383]|uniref:hypothetical protein n=1 Tax=Nonomuraea sp. NPDC050383 TaxID=3364362 RepID=UPI0037BC6C7C